MINAVLCTVTPVLLTILAVRRLGPVLVSQVGMIGPVMILGFGYWFLGEPITWIQLTGTALVLFGIGLAGVWPALPNLFNTAKTCGKTIDLKGAIREDAG